MVSLSNADKERVTSERYLLIDGYNPTIKEGKRQMKNRPAPRWCQAVHVLACGLAAADFQSAFFTRMGNGQALQRLPPGLRRNVPGKSARRVHFALFLDRSIGILRCDFAHGMFPLQLKGRYCDFLGFLGQTPSIYSIH